MTIKYIRFSRPVTFQGALGGSDFWSPTKFPDVSAARKDGGITLTAKLPAAGGGGVEHVQVPMTNVDQVTYSDDDVKPTQKGKGEA